MAPSLPVVLAEWARTPLDVLLKQPEEGGGACEPLGARQRALELAQVAEAKVPAFRQFLAAGGEAGEEAGGEEECGRADAPSPPTAAPAAAAACHTWQAVPFSSKQNYVQRYPLEQRCAGGALPGAGDFVHCSSGSSGEPTLWARNAFDELAVCTRFEQLFGDGWQAHQQATLAVVAFPLGSWVGGLFTTLCIRYLTLKGYRITAVTPGNKVSDILQLVQALAPQFQQTVLLGYPPFLKGVVDAGVAAGVPWPAYRMRLCLAGEVFSEEWRSLMAQRLGLADILRDVASFVAIRRWLAQRPEAAAQLFGAQRLPSLLQYDPYSRLLERHPEDGTLVVSAIGTPNTAAPLLRYCIGDAGGTIAYADMLAFVGERGFEMPADLQPRKLPFVFGFGRSMWVVSVFGANVFVENLMAGLEQPELAEAATGKFVLFVEKGADLDRQLAVRVELAPGVQPGEALAAQARQGCIVWVARVLLRELLRLNSEYSSYVPAERQLPRVYLHPHGDPAHFPAGVKHKWTL